MLSDTEVRWLVEAAKRWRNTLVGGDLFQDVDAHIKRIEAELEEPLELLIHCPRCLKQHVDEGKFKEPHKRHSCQFCGLLFSVTKDMPNIGVQFFAGCGPGDAQLSFPQTQFKVTPGSKPSMSMPFGPERAKYIKSGVKVMLREEARYMGYNMEKEYEVDDVSFTDLTALLKGDPDIPMRIKIDLLDPVLW